MKVLLLNGSPHPTGCTYTALHEIEVQLQAAGIKTRLVTVGNSPIRGCIACRQCKKTGLCTIHDDPVNDCIKIFEEADAVILGSPVYYASANGNFISFLDRLFYASNFDKRFKLGASVVSCRRGGASATFDQLNKYFTISSMPVVSSQYWNSVHGNKPEEVLKDEEGMQTMRTLADNMIYLLQCLQLGKQHLVQPEQTQKIMTNFIR